MDAALQNRRRRRLRWVGIVFALLSLGGMAAVLVPSLDARRPIFEESDRSNPGRVAIAAARTLEVHPLGGLLVPYEHASMQRFIERAAVGNVDSDDARYAASSVSVFYYVLEEMTWLMVALFALGFIGALFAIFGMGITGGVLMLLPVPVPVFTVGPAAALLTLPLLVGGVLALVVRPRREPPDLSQVEISDRATTPSSARSSIISGILLLVLGLASLALAVGMGGNAKLWIGAAGCTIGGIIVLVMGLVQWGREQDKR